MFLYQVFQSWETLGQASQLGRGEINVSELVQAKLVSAEADILRILNGETDQRMIKSDRGRTLQSIQSEVHILSQRAKEIQVAIAQGIDVILGIYEEKKAFLRTTDASLIEIPYNLEGMYLLRAAIPGRFQKVPPLPSKLVPIVSDESRKMINQWPLHIQTDFIGRQVQCLPGLTFSEVKSWLQEHRNYPYFLKTFAKNAAMEIHSDGDLEEFSAQIKRDEETYDTSGYIVSDIMHIQKDEGGKREFRAYIVNGKVMSISRNTLNQTCDSTRMISSQLHAFCHDFACMHSELQTYVLDVAECSDNRVRVVELNDFCYSGRFADNNFGIILNGFR